MHSEPPLAATHCCVGDVKLTVSSCGSLARGRLQGPHMETSGEQLGMFVLTSFRNEVPEPEASKAITGLSFVAHLMRRGLREP